MEKKRFVKEIDCDFEEQRHEIDVREETRIP